MKNLITILSIGIILISCTKQDVSEFDNEKLKTENAKKIVESNTDFAFDFFKEVYQNETNENLMVSPLSLSLALGMTYNGTETETKEAFENVLKYQMPLPEVNQFNKDLITYLKSETNGSVMEIANSIWVNKDFLVEKDFIDINKNYYFAEVKNLDFGNPSSVNTINNWVSEKTHNRIPKIISKINQDDVMFLINALYFNAKWKHEFETKNTSPKPFYITSTETYNTPTMSLRTDAEYQENELFSSIILPYKDDKFSMVILLPNETSSVQGVIQQLNSENWTNWLLNYKQVNILINMPKFKLEYKRTLNEDMKNLGLEIAFSGLADFSKINSNTGLCITNIIQKTYIDVNESGTEAAAGTSISIGITTISPGIILTFDLNRPFIYIIKDNETEAICFMGVVSKPEYID